MPQVPVYDQPRVERQALRGGYQQINTDAGAFGAVQGQQLQALGGAITSLAEVQARSEERADKTAVLDADSRIKEEYGVWAAEESKKMGEAAKGSAERARQWWKQSTERYVKDMTPRAQQAFTNAARNQATVASTHFADHENRQAEVAAQASTDAAIVKSIKLATELPTQQNIEAQKGAIIGALKLYGGDRWNPEVMAEKVAAQVSTMHRSVFDNILADPKNGPMAAKAYFEKYRGEFDPRQLDEINTKLKAGVAEAEGGVGARTAIAEASKGLKTSEPLPYEALDAKLVEQFADKPDSLKAARAELDRMVGIRNTNIAKVEASAMKEISAAYAAGNTSLQALKRLPAWDQLSGTAQMQMTEHIADRNHMMWARSIEDRRRVELEQQRKYAPQMLKWSQPEELAKMSQDSIMQLMPQIGVENTDRLLQTWKSFQGNQAKLTEAKIDNDSFNAAYYKGTGINPKSERLTPEQATKVQETRSLIETAIGSMQRSKGRELTREEKDAEIKRVTNSEVIKGGWFGGPTKEIKLDDKQIRESSVKITAVGKGGKAVEQVVPVANVPTDEFSAIQAKLRTRGLPATTKDVVQYWHDFKTNQREGKW